MLNGPCGGSREDRCEVSPDTECAWQLIYQRLTNIDQADKLKKIPMTTRETSDLIMMGIGAFTPLDGFMGHDDMRRLAVGV